GARPLDDEFGISEFPHLIVNQARVLDYFARFAKQGPARITPDYGWSFIGLEVSEEGEVPDAVTVEDTDGNQRVIHTQYVVGCDVAQSGVHKSIGRTMAGDKANHAWGVADVVVESNFQDWRTQVAILAKARSALHF